MSMLDQPLETAEAYVAYLACRDLPVLRQTRRELEVLREHEDTVNGKRIAAVVLGDPLFTLKLLAWLQAHRHRSQNHDITTIDRAIMMIGVRPFFEAFADVTTVEDKLAAHPQALIGALGVIGWTRRAAHFARDWAIVRHDLDVEEITVAALLRQATEIMLWIFAPTLTRRVQTMQRENPDLRSAIAQRAVFRTTEREIQSGLAREWNLPALLIMLMDEENAANPRVRNVRLAINFSRHLSRGGWENPALPDDIAEIGRLLPIGHDQLLARLGVPGPAAHRFRPLPP